MLYCMTLHMKRSFTSESSKVSSEGFKAPREQKSLLVQSLTGHFHMESHMNCNVHNGLQMQFSSQ